MTIFQILKDLLAAFLASSAELRAIRAEQASQKTTLAKILEAIGEPVDSKEASMELIEVAEKIVSVGAHIQAMADKLSTISD